MDAQFVQTYQTASPIPQVCITIPPGMRVLEYTGAVTPKKKGCTEYADDDPQKPASAPRFHDLPRFNAENFMKIATTGKYMDGTNVSDSLLVRTQGTAQRRQVRARRLPLSRHLLVQQDRH